MGKLIVEDEQQGKAKVAYGKEVLRNLSRQLTHEFGKGLDESNLRNIRLPGFPNSCTSDFYTDLVFYNYFLKCFVLIDLKTDKLTHAAIGQMDR